MAAVGRLRSLPSSGWRGEAERAFAAVAASHGGIAVAEVEAMIEANGGRDEFDTLMAVDCLKITKLEFLNFLVTLEAEKGVLYVSTLLKTLKAGARGLARRRSRAPGRTEPERWADGVVVSTQIQSKVLKGLTSLIRDRKVIDKDIAIALSHHQTLEEKRIEEGGVASGSSSGWSKRMLAAKLEAVDHELEEEAKASGWSQRLLAVRKAESEEAIEEEAAAAAERKAAPEKKAVEENTAADAEKEHLADEIIQRADATMKVDDEAAADLKATAKSSQSPEEEDEEDLPDLRPEIEQQAREVFTLTAASGGVATTVRKEDLVRAHNGDFKVFEKMDKNSDGEVTLDEWIVFLKRTKKKKGPKKWEKWITGFLTTLSTNLKTDSATE